MDFIKKNGAGMDFCLIIAVISYILGKMFPIIGGPVFAILLGMVVTQFVKNKKPFEAGIKFTSKKILQYAVILLGFGLNLNVILETGAQSLPIILATISTSLIIAFAMCKLLHMPAKISTLVGVGSSICGGSAVAATAPVIDADDEEVAQAISVIFFFNVLAALIFPHLGSWIGFSTVDGNAFGIFAGTAINDTSSVTAAAATWDNMWGLGSETLDKAVTVKLTRTLAIIPITLVLSMLQVSGAKTGVADAGGCSVNNAGKNVGNESSIDDNGKVASSKFNFRKVFPFFILYFIGASVITTVATSMGVDSAVFGPLKDLSKFFIVWAMAAIGLNTNIVKLVKTGGKPLLLGFSCWCGITIVSLAMQHLMGIW